MVTIQTGIEQERREQDSSILVLVIGALVALAVILGALLVFDSESGSAIPTEVAQVIADFEYSIVTHDAATMEAVLTEDFFSSQYSFAQGADSMYSDESMDRAHFIRYTAYAPDWRVETMDESIVVGDGPWYVSVHQAWIIQDLSRWEGLATYTVVDQGRTKRIAHYQFVATTTSKDET
jgi:hypothetical protein